MDENNTAIVNGEEVLEESKDIEVPEYNELFGNVWDDDSEQPMPDYYDGADAEPAETVQEDTEEQTDPSETEVPETAENTDTAEPEQVTEEQPADPQFELKHFDEVKTVGRDEVITLAQKGMDYDRIRSDRDNLKQENKRLTIFEDFLKKLAGDEMTVEDLMDRTLADVYSQKDNISKDVALERAKNDRLEKSKGIAPKTAEQLRSDDFLEFAQAHPDIKPDEIPQEVWNEVVNRDMHLTDAYAHYEARSLKQTLKQTVEAKDAEIATLKSRIEVLENNEKNRARSTGSAKSAGSSSNNKGVFSSAWDDYNN